MILEPIYSGIKIYKLAVLKQITPRKNNDSKNINDTMPLFTKIHAKNPPENLNMVEIDATGLSCPGPILKLTKNIKKIAFGSKLKVTASDMSFEADIVTWCDKTGHILHYCASTDGLTTAIIQKKQPVLT